MDVTDTKMKTILHVSCVLLILAISFGETDSLRISRWKPSWLGRACPRNYCSNGGVCRRQRKSISCECSSGFSGRRCECESDECATNNPCQFNSLCLNNVDGPGVTCRCPPGYSGQNCEININDCTAESCKNGGTCVDGIDSFSCNCPETFKGRFCEVGPKVDLCVTDNPCQFNSLCLNNVDGSGVTCTCPTGFSGQNCELNINDCTDESCKNGGTCVDGIDSFSCTCRTNYKGKFCELDCRGTFRQVEGREAVFQSAEVNFDQSSCGVSDCGPQCGYFTNNSTCRSYDNPVFSALSFSGNSDLTAECVGFCMINDHICKFANAITLENGDLICLLFNADILTVGAFDNHDSTLIQKIDGCFEDP